MKKILTASLVFVLVYNLFFFREYFGLVTGFIYLALNLYYYLIRNPNEKNLRFALLASGLSVLFGFLVAYRDNDIVQLANFFIAGFFSTVALHLYKSDRTFVVSLPTFILTPFSVLKNSLQSIPLLTKAELWANSRLEKEATAAIFRGILITIPVLIVLLILLLNADPIFGTLTARILENIGERIVYSLIVFVALVLIGITTIQDRDTQLQKDVEPKKIAHRIYEIGIVTGSVAVLFAVFMAVQFRYLFSVVNLSDLKYLSIDITTYSQYVRQGFFELLAASIIACIVVVYALKFIHHFVGRNKTIAQAIAALLTIETGLLLLSAFKRLSLYADDHGLTRARIFGFVFLVWLAAMLILLLIHVLKRLSAKQIFQSALASFLVAGIFINTINIDHVIATKYRPTVNNEIDYYYISNLSTDAHESWPALIASIEKEVQRLNTQQGFSPDDARITSLSQWTLDRLDRDITYLTQKYDGEKKWQKFNASEYMAYVAIKTDRKQYDKVSQLRNTLNGIQGKMNQELYNSAPIDRSTQPPLMEVQH
jgi:hypothetical protein